MTTLRALATDVRGAVGLGILVLLCGLALLAPVIAPVDPATQGDILQNRFLAPLTLGSDGITHWLGTDALGRDVLSRLVYGARISRAVGFFSVAVSILLGTAIGVASAVLGGLAERVLMAITDTALAAMSSRQFPLQLSTAPAPPL